MWLDLPAWCIGIANLILIPAVHITVSWFFEKKVRRDAFQPDRFPLRTFGWERERRVYETFLLVKQWKDCVPDGAKWVGGFEKSRLRESSRDFLEDFRKETCRGEVAHWVQMGFLWAFVIWNPGIAAGILLVYGALSNLPCIIIQRYNRCRLDRVLLRHSL